MKRRSTPVQGDLLSSMSAPPVLTCLQNNRDELVELLSKLLKEVAQDTPTRALMEKNHD